MNPALKIRTEILGPAGTQGTVLETRGTSARLSTSGGSKWVNADVAVRPGDLVTIRGERIVSKRTGGIGGAIKVYQV